MTDRPSALALTPLLLFVAIFFGAGLYYSIQGEPMGFYQLRAPVAILPALALAALIAWRRGIRAGEALLDKTCFLSLIDADRFAEPIQKGRSCREIRRKLPPHKGTCWPQTICGFFCFSPPHPGT